MVLLINHAKDCAERVSTHIHLPCLGFCLLVCIQFFNMHLRIYISWALELDYLIFLYIFFKQPWVMAVLLPGTTSHLPLPPQLEVIAMTSSLSSSSFQLPPMCHLLSPLKQKVGGRRQPRFLWSFPHHYQWCKRLHQNFIVSLEGIQEVNTLASIISRKQRLPSRCHIQQCKKALRVFCTSSNSAKGSLELDVTCAPFKFKDMLCFCPSWLPAMLKSTSSFFKGKSLCITQYNYSYICNYNYV